MKKFRKETFGTRTIYYYWGDKEIGRKQGNCYYLFDDRYVGWHDWAFNITWRECSYEDKYGELHISLFGWHSVFKTRIKSKRFPYGDCDAPTYGISIHDNTLWIMKGGNGNMNGGCKWWAWEIPFFTYKHISRKIECKDGVMRDYDEIMKSSEEYKPISESPIVNVRNYYYTDSYDESIIPCKYWVEQREWRPKWLTWTRLFKRVWKYIEIEFSKEVGKGKGSWKGGVVGCSYDIKDGETPIQCLMRMENERKF